MIDSSLYPHEFLYAGVVYLEDGSSRWQTNVLLDISSAPTIHHKHYVRQDTYYVYINEGCKERGMYMCVPVDKSQVDGSSDIGRGENDNI